MTYTLNVMLSAPLCRLSIECVTRYADKVAAEFVSTIPCESDQLIMTKGIQRCNSSIHISLEYCSALAELPTRPLHCQQHIFAAK